MCIYTIVLNCTHKNSWDGIFHILCILSQLKIAIKKVILSGKQEDTWTWEIMLPKDDLTLASRDKSHSNWPLTLGFPFLVHSVLQIIYCLIFLAMTCKEPFFFFFLLPFKGQKISMKRSLSVWIVHWWTELTRFVVSYPVLRVLSVDC